MKKIILMAGLFLSAPLQANDLTCEENYHHFKSIMIEGEKTFKKGDVNEVMHFIDSSLYTNAFSADQNEIKKYVNGEWLSPNEFKHYIAVTIKLWQVSDNSSVDISFAQPKINMITDIGEICVIPTKTRYMMFGKHYDVQFDQIYIKNIQTEKWKSFIYMGVENKKDMEKLVPHLLSKVKLSQYLSNNKNIVDHTIDIAKEYLSVQNIDLDNSEKIIKTLKKHMEKEQYMLKINGYK